LKSLAATMTAAFLVAPGWAQESSSFVPQPLEKVGFEQKLGAQLPLDTVFRDETGAEIRLGSLLGERPAILALVYYECPMLCPLIMNGLTQSLKTLSFSPGEEFDVVALSFDPGEGPEQAAHSKTVHLQRYGRPESAAGWHFLTGSEESIRALTDAVGFSYAYDPQQDEYAHAAGLVVLTPDGRVARYFYGIEYPPRDLRFGLVEAAEGTIGSLVDQVLLYCYRYDPTTGTYSAVVMNIVRLGGLVTVCALAIFVLAAWRVERRLVAMERST
jgi:protein SCO1/2